LYGGSTALSLKPLVDVLRLSTLHFVVILQSQIKTEGIGYGDDYF
jgi:hypothetical protein